MMSSGGSISAPELDHLASMADAMTKLGMLKDGDVVKANIDALKVRQKAAADANDAANATIAEAAKRDASSTSREAALNTREAAAADKDMRLGTRNDELKIWAADLKLREDTLADQHKAFDEQIAEAKEDLATQESAANTRLANAQAALDKRATDLKSREEQVEASMAATNAARADLERRLAGIQKFAG